MEDAIADQGTTARDQEEIRTASLAEPKELVLIERQLLFESPHNPRKRWGDLDELTASIRSVGLLQPLVVMPDPEHPVPAGGTPYRYRIVAGHRRFRAGIRAGLNEFRCEVRTDLTEDRIFEIQVIENAQREDLHPLEEAEHFEAMLARGYTVGTIATRVGKSTGHVYQRKSLLKLCPEARNAYVERPDDGRRMPFNVAVAISRFPHQVQAKAVEQLDRGLNEAEQLEYLRSDFARHLKGAPFDLKDSTLPRLPQNGGEVTYGDCATCPLNAKNLPRELFADFSTIDRAGLCLFTACYDGKCHAVIDRKAEAAKAKGQKMLTAAEARKAISGGSPLPGSPYVNADDVIADDPKNRTWRQLFAELPKDERPEITIAPNDVKRGEVFDLYDRAQAVELAGKIGADFAQRQAPEDKQVAANKVKKRKTNEKVHLVATVTALAFPKLIAQWRKAPALPELRALALMSLEEIGGDVAREVGSALEAGTTHHDLEKWIGRKATAKDLIAFVLGASMLPRWLDGGEEFNREFVAVAKNAKVDLKAMTRAQLQAAKIEAAANAPRQLQWKEVEGGAEVTVKTKAHGKTRYGVSYNGGDYYWTAETKAEGVIAEGDCKTLDAGIDKAEKHAAKAEVIK